MGRNAGWHVLLALVAIGIGFAFSLPAWRHRGEQTDRAQHARDELRAAEAERVDLMTSEAQLNNAIGREEIVRERGYRRANETPIEQGP